MIRAAERFAVRPTEDHPWGRRQQAPSTGRLLLALVVAAVIGVAVGLVLPVDGPMVAWNGGIPIAPAAGR